MRFNNDANANYIGQADAALVYELWLGPKVDDSVAKNLYVNSIGICMVGIVPIDIWNKRTMPFLKLREPHGASNHKPIWYLLWHPKCTIWHGQKFNTSAHRMLDRTLRKIRGNGIGHGRICPFEKYMWLIKDRIRICDVTKKKKTIAI